CQKYITAPFTF
nr:immunoglobulin light chain junction region [Macaca mulatta]